MRKAMRALRTSSSRSEAGAAAVEFAIVVPLLLLLLFGIFDYGRFFLVQMALTSGAQEGVRASVLGQSDSNVINSALTSVPTQAIALGVLTDAAVCDTLTIPPATPNYYGCVDRSTVSCASNPATGVTSVNLTLSFSWIATGALWFFNSPIQPQTVTTTAKAKCNG